MSQFYRVNQERTRWVWLELKGKESSDFLHRLSTVDIKSLSVGQGTPGCFLSPLGKIRSYFTIWKISDQEFGFELDPGESGSWKSEFKAFIDQYTFAEKLVLTEPKLECIWLFGDSGESGTLRMEGQVRVCHHGTRAFGKSWTSIWGDSSQLQAWMEASAPGARECLKDEVEGWRVLAMTPEMDAEITNSTQPLEVGLVEAIAKNKGCYPGQEVIEKVISLGAPAKRLSLIRLENSVPALSAGSPIYNLADPPIEVGVVTSKGSGCLLGLLRKIHAQEGLSVRVGKELVSGKVAAVTPYLEN